MIQHVEDVRELKLDDLVIGKGQVRVRDVAKDIEELAESINKVGLLEPIVVCPAEQPGKYEILIGQRRFMAHQRLQRDKIRAVVLNERVDETTAKVLSITENLVRRDPNRKDLIDACTALFRTYGTAKAVAEETGLSYNKVREYIKFDRLHTDLKKLVEAGTVDLKAALRAQDAASVSGTLDPKEAIQFAKEMAQMSGAMREKVVKTREDNPKSSAEEAIESAKTGAKLTKVSVLLTDTVDKSLRSYAEDDGMSREDAAATLIEEALSNKGFTSP